MSDKCETPNVVKMVITNSQFYQTETQCGKHRNKQEVVNIPEKTDERLCGATHYTLNVYKNWNIVVVDCNSQ